MRIKHIRFKLETILFLFILVSIQVNNSKYFIEISGLSIRYYMIFILLGLFFIIFNRRKVLVEWLLNYIFIFLFGIISFLYSPFPVEFSHVLKYSIFFLFQMICYFVILNIYFKINNREKAKLFKILLFIFSFSSLILYTIQLPITYGSYSTTYLGIFYGHNGVPRMTGFFEDPNYFGLYINTFMFIFIFVKYKYEHKFNRTDYLILIISILCIVLTHSRAAMISDFIAIFLLFLTLKKNLKIKLATISSFFLIIIIGIIYYSFPDYLNEIFSRYSFSGGSFSERLKLMKIGLNNIVRYPFGVGLGNVQFYYNEFYGKLKLAHNDFLSVFIETGVIGITFYILYFIRIFILSGKYGKILIITLFIHLNTLSCYKYEPIIPIALAILILESKYNYYFKEG